MPSGAVMTKRDSWLIGSDQRYRLRARNAVNPRISGRCPNIAGSHFPTIADTATYPFVTNQVINSATPKAKKAKTTDG
jgi:hypothetical protein